MPYHWHFVVWPQAAHLLSAWPVPVPSDWVERVNAPQSEAELEAVRRSMQRGCPFGSAAWQKQMAARLDRRKPGNQQMRVLPRLAQKGAFAHAKKKRIGLAFSCHGSAWNLVSRGPALSVKSCRARTSGDCPL
jgi:hypothetical protein